MAKFSKEYINNIRESLIKYFVNDFTKLLKSHFEDNHMWFYGKSVFRVIKDLNLKKAEVIFVLLGSNKLYPAWGNMSDMNIEPASIEIFKLYKELIKKTLPGYIADIELTERPVNDGNFKVYVKLRNNSEIAKFSEITDNSEIAEISGIKDSNKITYAKVAKTEKTEKELITLTPSSPSIVRIVEMMRQTSPVNITSNENNNKTNSLDEIDSIRKELDEVKNELSKLYKLFESKFNEVSTVKSSISRASSESLIHLAVDEDLDKGERWDDIMHPPTPKKSPITVPS